jgi:hypothetical protein
MRKSRYLLDRDLKDKFTAQSIDKNVIDLHLTSSLLYLKEGITHIDPRYVINNSCVDHMGKYKITKELFLMRLVKLVDHR